MFRILTTFDYDLSGRLTTAITGFALSTYSYDPNGNLVVVSSLTGLVTMSYDIENRLVLHVQSGMSSASAATYSYSGDGLKRLELVAGSPTTLVWDGANYLQGRS
jgi:YD repeat-containing protein